MQGDEQHELRDERLRQRIGPAIKELRERESWSLRDFARRCNVSSAYLSRIERGASVPSFAILARIASAFQVNPEYFIQFERAAEQIETSLAAVLDRLEIPRSIWHEFADLSIEAQSALVDAFSRSIDPEQSASQLQPDAEMAVLNEGVAASAELLNQIVISNGLSPVDFARHRTQLEEQEGSRFVLLDRLCTLPAPNLFNQLEVFQSTFGLKMDDPMLLKWWIRAQRSALRTSLNGSESRAVYPLNEIREYIRTGHWGTTLSFPLDLVRKHVEATIRLLETCPTYHVGLCEEPAPLRLVGKTGVGVLLMRLASVDHPYDEASGIALRFSDSTVVELFSTYFDEIWDGIPESYRDNNAVAAWLRNELQEAHVTSSFSRES